MLGTFIDRLLEIALAVCLLLGFLAAVGVLAWSDVKGYTGMIMVPCMLIIIWRQRRARHRDPNNR